MAAEFTYEGVVLRVHDGDTIACDLHRTMDFGFHLLHTMTWRNRRIRLANLYSPELTEKGGQEALAYALTLIKVGDTVDVTSLDVREFDNYGRVLGKVTLADGRDFAEVMIAAGHGTAKP